jgi:putative acetyltransferase
MSPKIQMGFAQSPADVAAVQDLFREFVFRIEREDSITVAYQDFAGEMETFPQRYEFLLLARVNGAAAAAVALNNLGGGDCEMKRLYCRDAFRGLGLARALCQNLMEEARARGFSQMRLDTHASMAPAIALYESLGFTPSQPHNEPGNACTLFFAREL